MTEASEDVEKRMHTWFAWSEWLHEIGRSKGIFWCVPNVDRLVHSADQDGFCAGTEREGG